METEKREAGRTTQVDLGPLRAAIIAQSTFGPAIIVATAAFAAALFVLVTRLAEIEAVMAAAARV